MDQTSLWTNSSLRLLHERCEISTSHQLHLPALLELFIAIPVLALSLINSTAPNTSKLDGINVLSKVAALNKSSVI
jgi:hypothetical protein